ncbi:MAG: hypothetical protein ABSE15_02705 [Candidatus Bathyarchaeia archaeon]
MTKAKFEIGETEKHTIIVNATALLKYITIEVDGKKVVNEKCLDLDTKNGGESND